MLPPQARYTASPGRGWRERIPTMDYILHQSVAHRSGKMITTTHHLHGFVCAECGGGYLFPIGKPIRSDVEAIIAGGTCPYCQAAIAYEMTQWESTRRLCCVGDCTGDGIERTSLGIYAGRYCDAHYATAFPFRKDGPEGYDYGDAGEHYDEDGL